MKVKKGIKRVIPALITTLAMVCIAFIVLAATGKAGYYITIGKSAHGTVVADKKRADAKETVTLTCNADEGYEVKEIYVNGEVSKETTFAMPEENVLVEVKFAMASAKKGETEAYEGDTPGAIAYKAIYPTGETHIVSWDFIYEKDGLAATAWVEGKPTNGDGVLLNLSKEELAPNGDFNYLPNNTYQIFCQYQKENDVISTKTTVQCADVEGIMQEKETDGIEAEIADWKEGGKTVGYQARIKVRYSLLGYNGKKAAMSSLVLLAGNRAEVLPNTIAEFWLDGEYDSENYLSYPRLVDDNTLQKNKFIDMTEMELEAYRDTGRVLDGEISNGEYRGTILEDATQGHRIKAQAHLTKGRNVQMVMEIESNTSFEEIVNAYPGVGQYLFAEIGLGNNDGQTCTMIKANVMGEVENAITAVKLIEDNKNSDYKYKAVIEMWIPKASISNNTNANIVRLSRLALFSGNMGQGSKADNIFLVARWADINNCNITTNGIKLESEIVPPEAETIGMDGILSDGEYKGTTIQNQSETHRVSVQGYLTEGKNIRLAIKIDANTAPDKIVNDFPSISKYLFVEAAFGNNTGENTEKSPVTLVKVNVLGQAAYAAAEVKTTDNGASAEYRYSTVIEMWIPQSSITNNTNPDRVEITRLALFAENREGSDNSQNLFAIAKWAGLNECYLTADGIKTKEDIAEEEAQVKAPESEAKGLDGVISDGEYKGAIVQNESNTHRVSVQGYLTKGKNIRLAVKVDANTAPDKEVNSYPGLSKYLFTELGFGENTGNGDCTLVKANVLGEATYADAVAKTTDNGKTADYRYTTVIEMWIPQSAITNNTDVDKVQITRLALFSDNHGDDAKANNTFVVAKWAQINECSLTANGIVLADDGETGSGNTVKIPETEKDGFDGVISDGEYTGWELDSTNSSVSTEYKMKVQGYVNEQGNIRLGMTINSKIDPKSVVNPEDHWSKYLFGEFAFGNNQGNEEETTIVRANVLGKAENADTVVNSSTSAGAEYPYTTVIEMWIPKESITDNPTPNMVQFTRAGLIHKTVENEKETWLVAKWASLYNCYVTTEGIVDSVVLGGMDGVIAKKEYPGTVIEEKANNYKVSVQGYLASDRAVRLGIQIHSNFDPADSENAYPGVGSKMFAEICLGNNEGDQDKQNATDANIVLNMIKANVAEKAENAVSVVKTTKNEEGSAYKYTTVIELYILESEITNNTNPEKVAISRLAIFNGNVEGSSVDNLYLIANWANIHKCTVTTGGIRANEEEAFLNAVGVDGVISENEYGDVRLVSDAAGQIDASKYLVEVRGIRLDGNKNMKLAVKIDSKTDPRQEGDNVYVEIGLGNRAAAQFTKLVKAYVSGKAENATITVKTTQNDANAAYPYTTVIEMYVPASVIDEEAATDGNTICIPRVYFYSDKLDGGVGRIVHRYDGNVDGDWGPYAWMWITGEGIKDVGTHDTCGEVGADGVISENEYGGEVITSVAGDWNILGNTNYYMTVRGKLLDDNRNMKIAVRVDSQSNPVEDNLHVKLGVGNTYPFTEYVTVYASGHTENTKAVVKTVENAEGADYAYTTIIEMYVSKNMIKEATATEGFACIPWVYLGANGLTDGGNRLIDRQTDGAGPYGWKCLTTEGIKDISIAEEENMLRKAGVDGVINGSEYGGSAVTSIAGEWNIIGTTDYYVTVQGKWIDNNKNIKVAVKVDSKNRLDENFRVELGLGNNNAADFTMLVNAYASGTATNAIGKVGCVDNGAAATYRYTTTIEIYIPNTSIQNDTNSDLVHIPRIYLYSGDNNFGRLIDRGGWHGGYAWAHIKADGLYN